MSPGDYLEWVGAGALARRVRGVARAVVQRERRRRRRRGSRRSARDARLLRDLRLAAADGPPLHGRGCACPARRASSCCRTPTGRTRSAGARRRRPDDHARRRAPRRSSACCRACPRSATFFVPLAARRRADRSQHADRSSCRRGWRAASSIDAARAEMDTHRRGARTRVSRRPTAAGSVNTRPLQEEFVGPQARLVFALLGGHRPRGAADRLRQHRQPAAGARRRASRRAGRAPGARRRRLAGRSSTAGRVRDARGAWRRAVACGLALDASILLSARRDRLAVGRERRTEPARCC